MTTGPRHAAHLPRPPTTVFPAVQSVLGMAMTGDGAGIVLLAGDGADGATVIREVVELPIPGRAADDVVASVSSIKRVAVARGYEVCSIAVTWTPAAEVEARAAVASLAAHDADVITIELPEAAAFVRGASSAPSSRGSAVCIIGDDETVVVQPDWHGGTIHTTTAFPADGALLGPLITILDGAKRPDVVFLIAPARLAGLTETITRELRDTRVAAFLTPAEAGLALARGAARAATMGRPAGRSRARGDTDLSPPRRPDVRVVVAVVSAASLTLVVSLGLLVTSLGTPSRADISPRNTEQHQDAVSASVRSSPATAIPPIRPTQAPAPTTPAPVSTTLTETIAAPVPTQVSGQPVQSPTEPLVSPNASLEPPPPEEPPPAEPPPVEGQRVINIPGLPPITLGAPPPPPPPPPEN